MPWTDRTRPYGSGPSRRRSDWYRARTPLIYCWGDHTIDDSFAGIVVSAACRRIKLPMLLSARLQGVLCPTCGHTARLQCKWGYRCCKNRQVVLVPFSICCKRQRHHGEIISSVQHFSNFSFFGISPDRSCPAACDFGEQGLHCFIMEQVYNTTGIPIE